MTKITLVILLLIIAGASCALPQPPEQKNALEKSISAESQKETAEIQVDNNPINKQEEEKKEKEIEASGGSQLDIKNEDLEKFEDEINNLKSEDLPGFKSL